MDEVSMNTDARYCKSSSRSINPAGRSPTPPGKRMRAALWGWVGGVPRRAEPLHTISGADSGFRRTAYLHPRRAKRRAQVCGDSTVKSVGQGKHSPAPVLAPHPPQAVLLPLCRGRHKRVLKWARLAMLGATLPPCGERSVAAPEACASLREAALSLLLVEEGGPLRGG